MPSVSAAVFRDGEVLWEQALGHADVEAKREATPQTQYRIGSITKTFTAVGIMQLRDAGELSLDDPLTAHLPESAHGPTIGRMLAHSSGLQREPPGEIWETMKAPSREELLAGTADAEQVLEPGHVVALLQPRVRAARRGRRPCARRHVGGGAAGAHPRPARLSRTTPEESEPAARGYFVEPYSTPSGSSPSSISAAPARSASSGRRRATSRAGAPSSPPATTACWRLATLEEMSHVRAMVDHAGWTVAWGTGLELYRRGETLFVGHGGAMPGHLAGLVVDRKTKIGAAVLTNTGRRRCAGEARARPRDGGDRRSARGGRSLAAGRPGARRDRAAARAVVDRGPRDRALVAEGPARGEAPRRRARPRHVLPRARRRGSLPQRRGPRARRAAARRPRRGRAGSRSSTSRRIRCGASRRRSSPPVGRRRGRRRPRRRRRRRSGSRP